MDCKISNEQDSDTSKKISVVKYSDEIEKYLVDIRQWIKTQEHLPQNIDERFLIKFYKCCFQDIDDAKNLIEVCFKIRSNCPEVFKNRDPMEKGTWNYLNYAHVVPLPVLTEKKYRITIVRTLKDIRYLDFVGSLKAFSLVSDTSILTETEDVLGEIPVYDFSTARFNHIFKFVMGPLGKYMHYIQEGHPVRLKEIHFINIPFYLSAFLNLIRPFVKNEVMDMVYLHTNLDTFYSFIPKEYLPSDYGGSLESLDVMKKDFLEKVYQHRDNFLDDSKWQVDETKLKIR